MNTFSEMKKIIEMAGFQSMVIDRLKQILADCEIEKENIRKNNGVMYHGVKIVRKGSSVGTINYLDEYKEQYEAGRAFVEIVEEIRRETIQAFQKKEEIEESIACIKVYDSIKDRIFCKLINTGANQELLKNIPHIPFLDLSITFYLNVSQWNNTIGCVTIQNNLMKEWKVEKETLYEAAIRNDRLCVEKIETVLKGLLENPEEIKVVKEFFAEERRPEMLIMSNRTRMYGAYGMLCTEKLYEIAQEKNSNLFILPSSVHETILVPDTEVSENGAKEIKSMVKAVNSSSILPEEVLSDNVYYFNRNTKEVTLLTTETEV